MMTNIQEKAALLSPAIRTLLLGENGCIVRHYTDDETENLIATRQAFGEMEKVFSKYSSGEYKGCRYIDNAETVDVQYELLQGAFSHGAKPGATNPALVAVSGVGVFSVSRTKSDADKTIADFLSARSGKALDATALVSAIDKNDKLFSGRIAGKVAIITGSAQGFGQGIAESMAEEGAYVVIADINEPLAQKLAETICKRYGEGRATAIYVDVTSGESIKELMVKTVLAYGGIDVFVSNAGILKAGSLEEMDCKTFELVTKINYTAYFLGVKYASHYMKIQNRFNESLFSDIIQINSKSGLEGSNKNFAYAGGKFGGIGLTQSFALELVEYNIKVNSICPGNFFEGPLWADPQNGLFAQYLRAKKVPGAKSIADVKKYYESKVPMKRGCTVRDVALAVFYIMEQAYETGQAVPVTGGQVMLR
jgi:NAD(P)-dependent dehydrogenase (short-subunit alcohol dehydrogenase family)